MSERRQHFRRRTLLEGRLEVDKLNGWALGCSIRNLSEGGARVTIPGDVVVPQSVQLTVSGRPRQPARLVWFRDGQAGFALADAPREAPTDVTGAAEPANDDRLAARLAAITAGRRQAHFTRS